MKSIFSKKEIEYKQTLGWGIWTNLIFSDLTLGCKGLELPVITFLNTNTISEFLSENYFSNSIYVVFLTTEFHKINRFVIYPIPNSFKALCMMVSLTAQNTNLMFSVSITCKEKERKKMKKAD